MTLHVDIRCSLHFAVLKHQHLTPFAIELVILGVFIGMQVSNWNQARVERERTNLVLDAFSKRVKWGQIPLNLITGTELPSKLSTAPTNAAFREDSSKIYCLEETGYMTVVANARQAADLWKRLRMRFRVTSTLRASRLQGRASTRGSSHSSC